MNIPPVMLGQDACIVRSGTLQGSGEHPWVLTTAPCCTCLASDSRGPVRYIVGSNRYEGLLLTTVVTPCIFFVLGDVVFATVRSGSSRSKADYGVQSADAVDDERHERYSKKPHVPKPVTSARTPGTPRNRLPVFYESLLATFMLLSSIQGDTRKSG